MLDKPNPGTPCSIDFFHVNATFSAPSCSPFHIFIITIKSTRASSIFCKIGNLSNSLWNHIFSLFCTDFEKDNLIRFEIKDNGVGMEEEVIKKLFTSFFSTKGHRGTGLGLMVTRKLIEEHSGTIDVKSEPGKGTTVTVRLPYQTLDGA